MSGGWSRRWLAAAFGASALLVTSAPLVGQLTVWLRDAAKGQYANVLAAMVIIPATVAMVTAIARIKERRPARYALLTAAVVIAIGYAAVSRSGVADVDAAERFHFIEYGLIALLYYKARRPAADASLLAVPLLAGIIVGTTEEWLQWFVPSRVGEARDVLLNLVALISGLLFALGLDPPPRSIPRLLPASRRTVGWLAAAAIVAFAAFFHSVHLGHEIADRDAGVFRSRYSEQRLAEVSADRAARWRDRPPLTWRRFSREDQYFSEALAHVRRRNERWGEGNLLAARHENLILERYYAPVLDAPSYVSASGHRWPAEQRAQADAQANPGFIIYESDALPYAVFTWSPVVYWLVVAVLAAAAAGVLRTIPPERKLRGL